MVKAKSILIFLSCLLFLRAASAQENQNRQTWKSGIELGSGLSLTGYNINLAYTGTFGNNLCFIGPKLVMSDANAFYDAPWGIHLGYRRLFPMTERFRMYATVEYQNIRFAFEGFGDERKNLLHEFHFSYGLEYTFFERWYLGNSVGAGGFIERLVDPFDGQVDQFVGYTGQVRFYLGYHFN